MRDGVNLFGDHLDRGGDERSHVVGLDVKKARNLVNSKGVTKCTEVGDGRFEVCIYVGQKLFRLPDCVVGLDERRVSVIQHALQLDDLRFELRNGA